MSLWIKNSNNEPSASLTLTVVSFTVIMFWMVISIFVNPFGLKTVPFNAGEAMTVLTPLLGLYFGRRFTDFQEKKHNVKKNKKNTVAENNVE